MITKTKLIFILSSGSEEVFNFDRKILLGSATFQIARKFYSCGGHTGRDIKLSSLFLSFDYSGRSAQLEPMIHVRAWASLCGMPACCVVVGGYCERPLKQCEMYWLDRNRWGELPLLREARYSSGSVVLVSKRLFSFSGAYGFEQHLNSIETLQIENREEWKTLTVTLSSACPSAAASL